VVESLRADLIAVISKYVEVDEKNCDVSFEQQDRAVAMLANVPILALRSRDVMPPPSSPPPPSSSGPSSGTPDPPPRGDALGAAYTVADQPNPAATPSSAPRKRKRRRRAGHKTVPAT